MVGDSADSAGQSPQRPDDVAAYILDGIDRQDDPDTLRAIADYAQARADYLEAIEAREVDVDQAVGDDEELVDVQEDGSKGAIVQKKISCGKASCSACPHGPYDYRVWRDGDKVRTEYLGPADS